MSVQKPLIDSDEDSEVQNLMFIFQAEDHVGEMNV